MPRESGLARNLLEVNFHRSPTPIVLLNFALYPARIALLFVVPLILLLGGCGGDQLVRGKLDHELRPAESRQQVYWPPAPDRPRLRYAGELLGEPNFSDLPGNQYNVVWRSALLVGKWLAGLFDDPRKMVMLRPIHGTTDAQGRIFVVDAGRNAILVFEAQTHQGEKGEGALQAWTHATELGEFQAPIAITTAWADTLAVSDASLKAVFLLAPDGKPLGSLGKGLLQRPTGLAFDRHRNRLYVADSEAHDIKVFARDGTLLQTIGRPGNELGELNAPTHLAFSGEALHVSDSLNNRIQVFNADGTPRQRIGEAGVHVGQLTRPKGVAFDPEHRIFYVVESYFAHLLLYNEDGDFLLGVSGSGLPNGQFTLPAGVWLGADHKIFVADMYNNRVVIFDYLKQAVN